MAVPLTQVQSGVPGVGSGVAAGATVVLFEGQGRGRALTAFVAADKQFAALIFVTPDGGTTWVVADEVDAGAPANGDATYVKATKLQSYNLPFFFRFGIKNTGAGNMAYVYDLQILENQALA